MRFPATTKYGCLLNKSINGRLRQEIKAQYGTCADKEDDDPTSVLVRNDHAPCLKY